MDFPGKSSPSNQKQILLFQGNWHTEEMEKIVKDVKKMDGYRQFVQKFRFFLFLFVYIQYNYRIKANCKEKGVVIC